MNFFKRPKKLEDTDDKKLLDSYLASGELAILGGLYEKKVPLVYGVCLKYLRDEEDAKDAVMGIFEDLINKVKLHDIGHFHSWLYVLSKNYCLMQLRTAQKMEVIGIDSFMEFSPLPHHEDISREAAMAALEQCLNKLTPAQKQSISLFYLKEKCYKEIAALTGFSLNEVKSYIQNGKRNLKICLEKQSD